MEVPIDPGLFSDSLNGAPEHAGIIGADIAEYSGSPPGLGDNLRLDERRGITLACPDKMRYILRLCVDEDDALDSHLS